jgi:3-dehydroquinate synthetase
VKNKFKIEINSDDNNSIFFIKDENVERSKTSSNNQIKIKIIKNDSIFFEKDEELKSISVIEDSTKSIIKNFFFLIF